MTDKADKSDSTLPPAANRELAKPWLVCAITTFAAMPTWCILLFFSIAAITQKPINNPAGLPIMFGVATNIAIVVAALNAAVIAPMIHRVFRRRGYLFTCLFYLVASTVLVSISCWLLAETGLANLPRWSIPIFAFDVLLLPPIVAGLMAYSIQRFRFERTI